MSQELHYTSAARGLKPGSRGFSTVAATASLPDSLAERLESLSGYRAVYPPGDPSETLNPVAFVHVRLSVGSQRLDVLSRIGPAGLDYSGRPNKYAHHLVLEPDERPEAGPAWLLSQPGLFQEAWQGEPRIIETGASVPVGDRPPGIASDWQAIAGDAGWAGVLAESFLADPRRPVFLVFRPGTELLPLFVEAIALLPTARRWDVEFSTYLTTLPPGINCTWRGVLDGSAEARNARRLPNALIVDLSRPAGRARGGALVHLARTGERPVEADDGGGAPAPSDRTTAATGSGLPGTYELSEASGFPPRPPTAGKGYPRKPVSADDRDWLPDLAARLGDDESWRGGESLAPRRSKYQVIVYSIVACLVLVGLGSIVLSPEVRRAIGIDPPRRRSLAARNADREKPPVPPVPVVANSRPTPPAGASDEPLPVAETPPPPPADLTDAPTRPSAVAPPAVVLAFAPPDVSRSALGERSGSSGELALPRPVDDRIVLRNASAFRLVAVPGTPRAWDVATQSNSVFARSFPLARFTRLNDHSWRFAWTDKAKAQAAYVGDLKDAVLEIHAEDGGILYVLLRGLTLSTERPLEVWKEQKLCDNPEPKVIRTIDWSGNPDALDRTRWKPVIRRWKIVITRPESQPALADETPPQHVVEPEAAGASQDPTKPAAAAVPLERDLIPGEVKLRLAIATDHPGSITVRVESDPEKLRLGRQDRASRLDRFRQETPHDKNNDPRDPLTYRRDQLRKLRDNGEKDPNKLQLLEREIAELTSLNRLRETDDLISHPARVTLSLVIGLEVEGAGILDIARIGDMGASP